MNKIPVRKIKSVRTENDVVGNFSIRKIESLLTEEDMVQELHRHEFFYLLVISTGAGSHVIDFAPYNISNNVIFFLRPGQVHQLKLKTGSTGFLIQIKPAFDSPGNNSFYQLLRSIQINHYQLQADIFQKFLRLMENIYEEYLLEAVSYKTVIKAYLEISFIELTRQSQVYKYTDSNFYLQEQLELFTRLLDQHISSYKLVKDYAGLMHLSNYQLNAITKKLLGQSASALIDEQIMLEAKRWLLATSMQVNQIADHLGYADVSYFTRFFKKQTGFSPEVFRKNCK
ncbi:MAG: AraC family transcriptional regulator [Bacteroidota bacterium]